VSQNSLQEAFSAQSLADLLQADCLLTELVGCSDTLCESIMPLAKAQPGSLSFAVSEKQAPLLEITKASVLILPSSLKAFIKPSVRACLYVTAPYLAYAKVSSLFDKCPAQDAGIHSSAIIHETANLGVNVYIGPNVVIEAQAKVSDNTYIGANSFIGARTQVGEGCRIHPNVTLYHDVQIGDRVIIHSSAVIGSDGFGFAPSQDGWVKIHQIGGVTLGDDVEVGAGTTIDRGALEDTFIGAGVKLDNQVQIAHNVHLGEHCAVAACVGIAGSTKLGKGCTVAGGVGIAGHLDITEDVHFTGNTTVTRSVRKPGSYSSGTVIEPSGQWRKNAARFRSLDELFRRVKMLEKKLS
jgi:UDP-3-O-[3-hydroxymyristoyl] glucosamine N-acyltransferase